MVIVERLPRSIRNYGQVERCPKEPPVTFDPGWPMGDYNMVEQQAIVRPKHLGFRTVRDGQWQSSVIDHGRNRLHKPRLLTERPVAVLIDMNNPDMPPSAIRLGAPFSDWVGPTRFSKTPRPKLSKELKKETVNARRRTTKIIS